MNFSDGSFNYCRAFYKCDRRSPGGSGWDTDFPGAVNNFSVRRHARVGSNGYAVGVNVVLYAMTH